MNDRVDEDYADAILNWWRVNGVRLIILLVLGGSGLSGWYAWQRQTNLAQEEIANLYYEVHETLLEESSYRRNDQPNKPEPAIAAATVVKEKHPNSVYAVFSALYLARVYVEQSDLSSSLAELAWALSKADDLLLRDVIRIRLARVHIAMENAKVALAVLDTLEGQEMRAQATEVRGDALYQQGEIDAAESAYLLAASEPPQSGQTTYIGWKIANWLSAKTLTDEEAKAAEQSRRFKIEPVKSEPAETAIEGDGEQPDDTESSTSDDTESSTSDDTESSTSDDTESSTSDDS